MRRAGVKKKEIRADRVTQVVEGLPSKHETLSSNTNIIQKTKRKKKERLYSKDAEKTIRNH
jgi:hypothetical protein